MDERVSIFEVAKRAECSIATVSNVLNNKGRVSQEKRNAVLEAVAALGYRVNSVGRNLRTRRTETFGLLFHPSCSELFQNPFYAEVMGGLEERLTKASYHLLLAGYEAASEAASAPEAGMPDFLSRGKVDGVILLGAFPTKVVERFHRFKIPLLLLDTNVDLPVDSVVSDGFAGEREAVRHLVARGHRRIVMMAYPEENYNIDLRVEGFLAGLAEAGLPAEGAVIRSSLAHDDLYAELRRRLDGPNAPTAITAVNDALAVALVQRLSRDGIRVPDRLSVVGYNDGRAATDAVPPLSTIRVDKKELGRIGAGLILNRATNPAAAVEKLRLPVEFVGRSSVAAPAA